MTDKAAALGATLTAAGTGWWIHPGAGLIVGGLWLVAAALCAAYLAGGNDNDDDNDNDEGATDA